MVAIVEAVAVGRGGGASEGVDDALGDGDRVAGAVAGVFAARTDDVTVVAAMRGDCPVGFVESFATVITLSTSTASATTPSTPNTTGVHRWRWPASKGVVGGSLEIAVTSYVVERCRRAVAYRIDLSEEAE